MRETTVEMALEAAKYEAMLETEHRIHQAKSRIWACAAWLVCLLALGLTVPIVFACIALAKMAAAWVP